MKHIPIHNQQRFTMNTIFSTIVLIALTVSTSSAWELPRFMLDTTSSNKTSKSTSSYAPFNLTEVSEWKNQSIWKGKATNATVSLAKPTIQPKATPTEYPTQSPTESPAPSPSPSDVPTEMPIISPYPTPAPTDSPTESPAPSPSPSDLPTAAPSDMPSGSPTMSPTISAQPSVTPSVSPSNVPSSSPSAPPTNYPTISAMPSTYPSVSPSGQPSMTPTISKAPSGSPSNAPSISMEPSDQPTHIDGVSANYEVYLPLSGGQTLTEMEVLAFESATSAWVNQKDAGTGDLQSVTTQIIKQTVVNTTTTLTVEQGTTRHLEYDASTTTSATTSGTATAGPALKIKFTIAGTYIGTDKKFSLYKEFNDAFQKLNPIWISMLVNENKVFEPLLPDIVSSATLPESNSNQGGMAPVGMAGLSVFAVLAVILGVIASIYSIRSYKQGVYGEELKSPTQSYDDIAGNVNDDNNDMNQNNSNQFHSSFQTEVMDVVERRKKFRVAIRSLEEEKFSTTEERQEGLEIQRENTITTWNSQPASPNTVERGGAVPPQVEGHSNLFMSNIAYQQNYQNDDDPYNNSQYNNFIQQYQNHQPQQQRQFMQDPPSAASEASFVLKNNQLKQASLFDNQTDLSSQLSEMTRSRNSHGISTLANHGHSNQTTYDLRQRSLDNRDDQSESSKQSSDYNDQSVVQSSVLETGPELALTKSHGGTLGAAAIGGDYAESDVSDFFYVLKNQGEDTSRSEKESTTLGARPAGPDEQEQFRERSSYESAARRGGLYDVFAPAGPIGIVVDTTKHGPSVHSLKSTSPMLGLINPGDLIVGLDDTDTRGMTAATLTRLMARKSTQKERKITLLATDNY